jgi:hypothetical protein
LTESVHYATTDSPHKAAGDKTMPKWNYNGDMNLEEGGFYWREADADDYVLAVRVTPCSDAGGPDNLFHIESGSIYIGDNPDRIASALDVIGQTPDDSTREDIVYALMAYAGIDGGSETVLRFGKDESDYCRGGGWNPAPDNVLRRNTDLRRYVERNFLD